ncbi:MAG: DUF4255 domain-containing protein [Chitinophagaceae bacterium]|nr:DUF4255 domain-containing protein [Chitinophagaceae bacterium]
MIDKAFRFLEGEVNAYFDARFEPATEKWVAMGNIAKLADNDANSNSSSSDAGSRAMFGLVNIEEDRIAKNPDPVVRTNAGIFYQNPRIFLNLYMLFVATHSSYSTSLLTISTIIQFFQGNRAFDVATHPGLDAGIERLTIDLYTLNFEQVNHLWGILGGKYQPSVMYKLKVIGIEDSANRVEGSLIREIVINDGIMPQKG